MKLSIIPISEQMLDKLREAKQMPNKINVQSMECESEWHNW